MATVCDVAAYILEAKGSMTAMKLQKLVYYSQAWSLVWDERPLFEEPIKAYANGPVAGVLYHEHRGRFKIGPGDITGDPSTLTEDERETVDAVLGFYGDKTSQWLSDLTHSEEPWKAAREGLELGERGEVVITHAAMAEYYGALA